MLALFVKVSTMYRP